MNLCVNCNQPVSTPYCSTCGQRSPVKEINFTNFWSDFAARIYGFDGMFPRTLKDLTIRPGEVAREYIKGNRVRYYGPVGYFFLMITLYLLIGSLLGVDMIEFTMKSNPTDVSQQGAGQAALTRDITIWINDNLRTVSFVIALFNVFFAWLFFRKSGYNLIQTAVLIFFVNGHILWLSVLAVVVYSVSGIVLNMGLIMVVSIVYLIFSVTNFYTHQSKAKIVFKSIAMYFTSYIVAMLLAMGYLTYKISTDSAFMEKIRPKNNRTNVEQTPPAK